MVTVRLLVQHATPSRMCTLFNVWLPEIVKESLEFEGPSAWNPTVLPVVIKLPPTAVYVQLPATMMVLTRVRSPEALLMMVAGIYVLVSFSPVIVWFPVPLMVMTISPLAQPTPLTSIFPWAEMAPGPLRFSPPPVWVLSSVNVPATVRVVPEPMVTVRSTVQHPEPSKK